MGHIFLSGHLDDYTLDVPPIFLGWLVDNVKSWFYHILL